MLRIFKAVGASSGGADRFVLERNFFMKSSIGCLLPPIDIKIECT